MAWLQVSSVTGHNYDLLHTFLNLLPANHDDGGNPEAPLEMPIHDTFSVPGCGTVISGNVFDGKVEVDGKYMLGPNCFGDFEEAHARVWCFECLKLDL